MTDTFNIALQQVLNALAPVLAMAEVASGRDLAQLAPEGHVEVFIRLAAGDSSRMLIEAVTPTERIKMIECRMLDATSPGGIQ